MIIKKLRASFGRLNGDALELEQGLNIIKAPNESGKSTWCAFIRAMLYGINTSDRDKQGYLSDKNKYLPWTGSPMSGEMELTYGGRDITLSRSTTSRGPMKEFSAVYTGTAEPVTELTGDNAGETLTGVGEKVFERTAFIRQAGLKVSSDNDLERRIAALVSSGSEERSFSETDAQLRGWMRKLKYNKSGEIPALEAELAALEDRLDRLEDENERLSALRQDIDRMTAKRDKLKEELELYRKIENRDMLRKLRDAETDLKRADEEIARITDKISVDGHVPTKDDIAELRAKCAQLSSLNVLHIKSLDTVNKGEKDLKTHEEELKNTAFYEKYGSEDAAFSKATFAAEYKPQPVSDADDGAAKRTSPKMIIWLILAIIGSIFTIAAYTAVQQLRDIAPVGVAFSILCLILCALSVKRERENAAAAAKRRAERADPMAEYYELFGTQDIEEIKTLCRDFLRKRSDIIQERAAAAAAQKTFSDAENSVKASENLVLSTAKRILHDISDPYDAESELAELERELDELNKAKLKKLSCANIADTLKAAIPENTDVSERDFLPVPMYSKEVTQRNYDEASAAVQELWREYNVTYGEIKSMGDPAVLRSEYGGIKERIAEKTEKFEALALAQRVLGEANSELQTRFSPLISRQAGRYMSILTGGRYSDLVFDKAFNAMAKASDEVISRNILSLSEGTADQIYLALRLAMSSLILSGDEPAPLILDDTFVNFDNVRCTHALRLLRKISEHRQVILFTCHDREAEFGRHSAGVNVIEIDDKTADTEEI